MGREPIPIIDDNAHDLLFVKTLLLGDDCGVQTPVDRGDAMPVFETHTPWLIPMDRRLSRMDDHEVTPQAKTDPAHRNVIVVAVSARSVTRDQKTISAGCDGYGSKPRDIERLLRFAGNIARPAAQGLRP
jgi:CheY-like chemotaxis protein